MTAEWMDQKAAHPIGTRPYPAAGLTEIFDAHWPAGASDSACDGRLHFQVEKSRTDPI
jgi:hypothetical protein